jgi:Amidohydrolase family
VQRWRELEFELMSESIKTCLAVFLLSLFQAAAESQQAAPDLVLLNGKIFTSDAAHPYVQALAIRGERITATGDTAKIRAIAGHHTKQIDLGGRTVIPGINDAHVHLSISPPSNRIDLQFKDPDPDWPEIKAAIAATLVKAPKGTLIQGEIAWKVFHDLAVNRDTLDQVAPNNPVILETFPGHAWIVNSSAMAQFGIREEQPNPVGGRYERSAGSPGSFANMRWKKCGGTSRTRRARRTLLESCAKRFPPPSSGGSRRSRTWRMTCRPIGVSRSLRKCRFQFAFG